MRPHLKEYLIEVGKGTWPSTLDLYFICSLQNNFKHYPVGLTTAL